MGTSQIPTSTPTRDWVQLATSTPTSGSTISYTSLASYRFYRIFFPIAVAFNGTSGIGFRINNDTSSSYTSTALQGIANDSGFLGVGAAWNFTAGSNSYAQGDIIIDNSNTALTTISGTLDVCARAFNNIEGFYSGNAQINRLDIIIIASAVAAANTASFTIYGSN